MSSLLVSQFPALIPTILCALAVFLLCSQFLPRKSQGLPLPPGPFRWPIVGNVFDFPRACQWITFSQWGNVYGNIIYSSVFGRPVVVLNSAKAAFDLLDKRSSIYSDRPHMIMVGDLMGWDHTLSLTPYNSRFRETRRLVRAVLGPGAVDKFYRLEEDVSTRFLGRLSDTPEDFLAHIRYAAGAIILSISYGYDVLEDRTDPLVQHAESTIEEGSIAGNPGAFLVDFIPWLKYIPASFPGMGFRRQAAIWRRHLLDMARVPHEFTKTQMAQGKARTSFVSSLLEEGTTSEKEELVKWAAFSLYAGGADTTVSSLSTFFLAMCTHPRIQLAAQAELDSVIGNERLPSVSDRVQLPYVNAVVKEVLRWAPVAPLGVAHRLTQDDVYEGYRIPAGALIIPNIWRMLHDPETFPNPGEFRPERFLGIEKADGITSNPAKLVFGFGRRACPGQDLAEAFLFLTIAMSLATFDVTKVHDGHGNVIEPDLEWTNGMVSHPKRFKCQIKPRSVRTVGLVRSVLAEQMRE